jgi:hypothetical protein
MLVQLNGVLGYLLQNSGIIAAFIQLWVDLSLKHFMVILPNILGLLKRMSCHLETCPYGLKRGNS